MGPLFAYRPPLAGATLPPLPAPVLPAAPLPAMPVKRWCYRCVDCLDVAFTREAVRGGQCGACGGPLECMGEVSGDKLIERRKDCACDYRCTGALGPMCDCHCGGVNHGTGREVEVVRVVGSVPVLRGQRDPCELRRRGDRFRATLARADAVLAGLHPGSVEAWRIRKAVAACRDARTAARVGKLSAVLDTFLTKSSHGA